MSVNRDYNKEFQIAKNAMNKAIRNYFEACKKKLMSDAIKRGIAEAKAKKQ